MCASLDVFEGPRTQLLGTETREGVVYSVSLKRIRYGSHPCETTGHLQWNSHKVLTLKAGTVEKLVEHLAPWRDTVDMWYRTCFLCTYKTFTSSDTVLQLLIQRYQSMEPCSSDSSKDALDKVAVQENIISFVRHWLESYPLDFCCPPSHPLLSQLHTLTRTSPPLQRAVDNLLLDFETRDLVEHGRCGASVDSGLGVPSEDSDLGDECDNCEDAIDDFDLCTLSPKQFAECLTTEDAEVFQHVTPRHCLEYVREPKNLRNGSSVRACIQHFNQVSLIVIATILGDSNVEGRASKIGRWIDIAGECRAIKNFSSLTAIISGLQSSSVYRLKRSWNYISSSKLSLFHELSSLLAADGNHQTSRDLLTKEGTAKYGGLPSPRRKRKDVQSAINGGIQGVVPYLGMYLTDLTMVHSAHSDLTETGLVNFDKRRKLFELLAQLTLYQKSAGNYHFSSHPGLVRWLHSTPLLSQQESYQTSKALEEDFPSNLTPSSTTKTLLSPTRLKAKFRYLFNARGIAVGDSHSLRPAHPLHIAKQLSDTASLDHLERVGSNEGFESRFCKRSNSLSPSMVRKYLGKSAVDTSQSQPLPGHVIQVAMTYSDHCNYKCLLVNENERAGSVIQRALKKFQVTEYESPSDYSLEQILGDKRTMEIPSDANVYYALCSETETEIIKAKLLIVKKT